MLRWSAPALLLTVLLGAGCARSAERCPAEGWSGQCELLDVTKVEDKEFPIPHVVLEATYRPLASAHYPDSTPRLATERTFVTSQYELSLGDHLRAHRRVACSVPASASADCGTGKLVVNVPAFDRAAADRAEGAPASLGCAQIEASDMQDRVQSSKAKSVFGERFVFLEGSAEPPVEANEAALRVATRLLATPAIECLGVVGQIASGESPGLGERRARAVIELLVQAGVPRSRLLPIGATANVFGSGSKPAEVDPKDRRVGLSVLLERGSP